MIRQGARRFAAGRVCWVVSVDMCVLVFVLVRVACVRVFVCLLYSRADTSGLCNIRDPHVDPSRRLVPYVLPPFVGMAHVQSQHAARASLSSQPVWMSGIPGAMANGSSTSPRYITRRG